MKRRPIILLVLGILGLATGSSRAEVMRGPDGNPVLGPDGFPITLTKLEAACATSLQRFCPDLSSTDGQTRNQAICLKPYRANLPATCRVAVGAVTK